MKRFLLGCLVVLGCGCADDPSPVGTFVNKRESETTIWAPTFNGQSKEKNGSVVMRDPLYEVTLRTDAGYAVVRVTKDVYDVVGPGWRYADWRFIAPGVEEPAGSSGGGR